MKISTPKAELGGTVIDCLVYGVYLAIFTRSVEVLSQKETYNRANKYLFVATLVLFCLITAHLGLDVDRAFRAFTDNTGTPHYAEGYFNILAGGEALAKNSAYVTTTLIADMFLVCIVTACLALVTFKRAEDPSGGKAVVAEVISRVKFMYICTLVLNLWCTLSIAARVWKVQRDSAGVQVSGIRVLRNTVAIIVESAAIYSAFTIILIASASNQSALMYAVLNPMPSIIGAVFSSIIVRVSSGRSFTTEKQSAMEFRGTSRHNYTSDRTLRTIDMTGSILPTANMHVHIKERTDDHNA
ncbi:hypothetical protein BDZ94DRAFT_1303301 [Collybia nuda]|uniref:Uncharacterized protein n=1 Tax=Collybia nuda TaxID=64659 RepID=A0A9P5YIM6_9AGAR|nr:hypothetical protein BDZ94DRAFT_1303301 [Collybia nuda]